MRFIIIIIIIIIIKSLFMTPILSLHLFKALFSFQVLIV
jgi:hypothetical protein